jgi:DNA-binding response OmpR family regulator
MPPASTWPRTPMIIMTARHGADDYITKPCSAHDVVGRGTWLTLIAKYFDHSQAVAAGAAVGVLGGLIELGGTEFQLPLLIGIFGFVAPRQ